jgi:hypothetical protein
MRYDVKGIDQNVLIQLYKNMLKSRMIEDKMIILLRQGKVSKWFQWYWSRSNFSWCYSSFKKGRVYSPYA